MAEIESPELEKRIAEAGPVDLVVGVTGSVSLSELCARAEASLQSVPAKSVVAYAGLPDQQPMTSCGGRVQLAAYSTSSTSAFAFWADISAAQRCVLALAAQRGARACLVVHNDLVAMEPETLRLLAEPVLSGQSDLVMPVYQHGKYEGLVNKSLLSPFSRALYGRRVNLPLAYDFCAGGKMLAKFAENGAAHGHSAAHLLWPANEAAIRNAPIAQAAVKAHHAAHTDHLELSAILTEFSGSLFQEAETNAPYWQRVRGSQAVMRFGAQAYPQEDAQPIDAKPMIESFQLGSRNLEEVWRLVLPPATMLELKRLTRLDVEHFRMPDALWARIVYDFALAHRMRRLSRTHLLGALTPLYLGWVASYTQEVATATVEEADKRVDLLGKIFEEQKPYFVSRWRWPERVS